jgi:hypothetical protein
MDDDDDDEYKEVPTMSENKRLRWSRGSVLAFGTQVRGFAPSRSRWVKKILSTPTFGEEVALRYVKDP